MRIEINKLKALALFAANDKDPRPYLQSIHLEVIDYKTVVMIACDGPSLSAICETYEGLHGLDIGNYIIPISIINSMKVGGSVDIGTEVNPMVGLSASVLFTFSNGDSSTVKCIDSKYPDWRRVIPTATSGEIGQFSNVYTSRAVKFLKLIGNGKDSDLLHIYHNGIGPAIVDTRFENVILIISPLSKPREEKVYFRPSFAIPK